MTLPAPIAVDAMGGDRAPDEIVAGAEQAADELDVPVVLVGDPDRLGRSSLEVIAASEVIAMDEDPGQGVRRKKDLFEKVFERRLDVISGAEPRRWRSGLEGVAREVNGKST